MTKATQHNGTAPSFNRRYDPFRRADWRWQRARALITAGSRPDRYDDPQTRAIYGNLKLIAPTATSGQSSVQSWPELEAAHRLRVSGGVLTDEIEARLLAGENFDSIAGRTGVASAVVRAYEAVFFNVADALSSRDWLLFTALRVQTWSLVLKQAKFFRNLAALFSADRDVP
ncbi:MAG TPA: hypothetical protein VFE47_24595 [Tepidisphaeraceae bacterium]|jgi:hypothetical protein|nr:hypothetical protein [Tepidisphaeraceae bacterium]